MFLTRFAVLWSWLFSPGMAKSESALFSKMPSRVINLEPNLTMNELQLVVDRVRGSGLEGSSLSAIFEGERKSSSLLWGARAFKK
jgi:hypothetical protein